MDGTLYLKYVALPNPYDEKSSNYEHLVCISPATFNADSFHIMFRVKDVYSGQ